MNFLFNQEKEAVVFCIEVSFRLAQVCKMVILGHIQPNSFKSLCQGSLSPVAFAQGESHLPRQSSEKALKSFLFSFYRIQPSKFITVLYHTALPTAVAFLLTSVQPERQLLPEKTLWFSARLCFPDVSFATLLSSYTGNVSALKIFVPPASTPKMEES